MARPIAGAARSSLPICSRESLKPLATLDSPQSGCATTHSAAGDDISRGVTTSYSQADLRILTQRTFRPGGRPIFTSTVSCRNPFPNPRAAFPSMRARNLSDPKGLRRKGRGRFVARLKRFDLSCHQPRKSNLISRDDKATASRRRLPHPEAKPTDVDRQNLTVSEHPALPTTETRTRISAHVGTAWPPSH